MCMCVWVCVCGCVCAGVGGFLLQVRKDARDGVSLDAQIATHSDSQADRTPRLSNVLFNIQYEMQKRSE